MALEFSSIPDAQETDAGTARPTRALSKLPRTSNRRGFFRALGLAGVGIGAAALTLGPLNRPRLASAATSDYGHSEYGADNCSDSYPSGYTQESDTQGAYTSGNGYQAACFGFDYRGSGYCRWRWHRSPIYTACGPSGAKRNSWQWKTPDGRVWRCSDGFDNGIYSICRARVA
ncbi:hypothetical protein [Nonomuraea turcica]|uniref:hypothetical protein n=1 Tax=Nonomuraea sp. G32 TaxID=3067274 RepID=UPI00273CC7AB|nr:hypothetical protein [Nonomuraea sp. G32]MDP4506850.1 hypothetical protein [Nonomuraea sp. G32]